MRLAARPVVCVAVLLAMSTPATGASATARDCGFEPGPMRAVAHVLDGDTLRLDDGKDVRLIGMLAPRAADAGAAPGTWPPEVASRQALADIVQGRSVALAFTGPRTDRYGRVLAHAFLVAADGSAADWVQVRQLEAGQARMFAAPGQDACSGKLIAAEAIARGTRRGLWANAAYQIRPADRPGELERYRGTYQIVTGRIAKAGGTRSLVTLDLVSSQAEQPTPPGATTTGARYRRSLRIVWRRDLQGILAVAGGGASNLAGADVEVRGWIELRGGPEIEVLGASQISIEPRQ